MTHQGQIRPSFEADLWVLSGEKQNCADLVSQEIYDFFWDEDGNCFPRGEGSKKEKLPEIKLNFPKISPKNEAECFLEKESVENICNYALACVNLYGMISLPDFVNLYNKYEEAELTLEQACCTLHHNFDETSVAVLDDGYLKPIHFVKYWEKYVDLWTQQQGNSDIYPIKKSFYDILVLNIFRLHQKLKK